MYLEDFKFSNFKVLFPCLLIKIILRLKNPRFQELSITEGHIVKEGKKMGKQTEMYPEFQEINEIIKQIAEHYSVRTLYTYDIVNTSQFSFH